MKQLFYCNKIIEAMDEIAPILTKTVTIKKINQWSTKGINTSNRTAYKMYKKVKKRVTA